MGIVKRPVYVTKSGVKRPVYVTKSGVNRPVYVNFVEKRCLNTYDTVGYAGMTAGTDLIDWNAPGASNQQRILSVWWRVSAGVSAASNLRMFGNDRMGIRRDVFGSIIGGVSTEIDFFNGCSIANFAAGSWHHFLICYKCGDSKVRGYTDGAFQSEFTVSGTTTHSPNFVVNGNLDQGMHYGPSGLWKPSSDLSDAQLASLASALYNSGKGLFYSQMSGSSFQLAHLTNFWDMDEISDGTTDVTREDKAGSDDLTNLSATYYCPHANDFPG